MTAEQHAPLISSRAQAQARRLANTAYHEAGHAVAAYWLQIGFVTVTVEPSDDYLGRVALERLGRRVFNTLEYGRISPVFRDKIERQIIVSLAGSIAEQRWGRRHNYVGSSGDYHNVWDFAERLSGSPAEARPYVEWLRQRTINVVTLHWRDIEALAQALLETPTLHHDAVVDVIEASVNARRQSTAVRRRSGEEAG